MAPRTICISDISAVGGRLLKTRNSKKTLTIFSHFAFRNTSRNIKKTPNEIDYSCGQPYVSHFALHNIIRDQKKTHTHTHAMRSDSSFIPVKILRTGIHFLWKKTVVINHCDLHENCWCTLNPFSTEAFSRIGVLRTLFCPTIVFLPCSQMRNYPTSTIYSLVFIPG